ncbi:MAG: serine hydrolase [Ruminococcus sp.]|nr:serine hydrolase [Ruminococcus sp.]
MKKICIIIAAILTAGLIFPENIHAEDVSGTSAYVLMEASTGIVLEEENSSKQLNIGYLSKLMTILLIAEDIETGKYLLSTELTASESVKDTKGSVIWLETGDRMTVDELLKAVIVGNANDAVTVLAEKSERSIENFTMRMNSEAFDLGLRDTAFLSPYGYYDKREYSTAHDVAVICSELAEYDFLKPYFKIWRDFIKEGKTELVNENTLSRTYENHAGFKAAHSEQSGFCIAEAGENESGICYIAVILNAPDSDTSFKEARQLIKKGFSNYKVTATMFPDEMLMPVKVRSGRETAVEISLRRQSRLVIPKNVAELSTAVVIPEYLNAPVKQGQVIGTAAFYSEKNQVCEIDIIAENDVEKLDFLYVFKEMLLNLLK